MIASRWNLRSDRGILMRGSVKHQQNDELLLYTTVSISGPPHVCRSRELKIVPWSPRFSSTCHNDADLTTADEKGFAFSGASMRSKPSGRTSFPPCLDFGARDPSSFPPKRQIRSLPKPTILPLRRYVKPDPSGCLRYIKCQQASGARGLGFWCVLATALSLRSLRNVQVFGRWTVPS